MTTVSKAILAATAEVPEGTLITAKSLLHLGSRAAIDQALARLTKRGSLIRAGRGLYVRAITSRFGTRAPSVESVVESVAVHKNEIIAPHGAAVANHMGLTTQVPMRSIYITSGPSRIFRFGRQEVELQHAPRWQLILAGRPAGDAVRALAWSGQEKAGSTLKVIKRRLPPAEVSALRGAASQLPGWLAKHVSRLPRVHA